MSEVNLNTVVVDNELCLKGQKEAFQAAIDGAPLEESLDWLIRAVTDGPGHDVRAAFYLTSEDGRRLHAVSTSAGVPATYLSIGTPVITRDVFEEPLWRPWLHLANEFDFRGCWSFPIETQAGKAVGTFAMYHREPRDATARDLAVALAVTRAAARIIWRHAQAEERRRAEEALRASLAECDALLKELHHHVKNNLQVIASLLEMQGRQTTDPGILSSLSEAGGRVAAIASLHELLYQSRSFSRVDLASYARRLVPHVVSLYQQASRIRVAVAGEDVAVDLARAVPFGLLLNELVSNACKHAFAPEDEGELSISLHRDDGHIHLRVSDSGVGLPDGFDDRTSATLGVQLVRMLARQLGGTVAFTSGEGTSVEVRLPADPQGP